MQRGDSSKYVCGVQLSFCSFEKRKEVRKKACTFVCPSVCVFRNLETPANVRLKFILEGCDG